MKTWLVFLGLLALAAPGCSAFRDHTQEKRSADKAAAGPPLLRGFDKEYQSMKERTSGMGMPAPPVSIDELMNQSQGLKGP